MTSKEPRRELVTAGLAWSSLDDATKALLRPLIDAGILVTRRDPDTSAVIVAYASRAVAWDSQAIAIYLAENREFLEWRQKIQARASLWDKGGLPPELLLSEEETRAAERNQTERAAQLTAAEIGYLRESLKRQTGYRATVAASEFTRMFSSPAQAAPAPSEVTRMMEAAAPQPPPSPAQAAPGEFTQMFQTAAPQPPPPQPAPPVSYQIAENETLTSLPVPPQLPPYAQALPPPASAPRRRFAPIAAMTAIGVAVLLGVLYFARLRTADPKKAQPSGTLQSQVIDQAQTDIQNGAYDDAIKILTQAIGAGMPLFSQRALAHRLSGNLDAAVADYDRAIKSGNADNQVYADEAYVLMLKGEWNQSVQLLSGAIHKDPSNVNFYVNRGKAYMAMGNFKAALGDFENALTRDPTSAAAQTGKADALQKLRMSVAKKDAPPRVYIQISSEVQRAQARHLQDTLTDLGYTVPPYEIVGQKSPAKNEVRFIYADDQAQAERLAADLRKANFPVDVKQIAAPHTPDVGFRHFELWFARVNTRSQQKAY